MLPRCEGALVFYVGLASPGSGLPAQLFASARIQIAAVGMPAEVGKALARMKMRVFLWGLFAGLRATTQSGVEKTRSRLLARGLTYAVILVCDKLFPRIVSLGSVTRGFGARGSRVSELPSIYMVRVRDHQVVIICFQEAFG